MKKTDSVKLWMHSKVFDVFYFQITGLLCLLVIIPYLIWKESSILPIYNVYLIFFGLPHNFLTWAHFMPANVRSSYNMPLIKRSAFICFVLCALIPFVRGGELETWILSLITYASLWHAYRQHHGICKIYDAIQMKRSGDKTLANDRSVMNVFFGLAIYAVLVWAFTKPEIHFLLSADEVYSLLYPRVPYSIFQAYVLVTILIGLWGLKLSLWDRYRKGLFLPWPQLGVMILALATYIVPYIFIPLEAMAVSVAIGTMFHNIQYFAFVWLMERYRAEELRSVQVELHRWQNFAAKGQWQRYFGLALLYSFVMIALYVALPHNTALALIYFVAFAHYIIDGHIWRHENNRWLSPTLKRLVLN
jgi:hypothetical protein